MKFPISKLWKKTVAEAPSYDKIGAAQALLEEVRLEGLEREIYEIKISLFNAVVLKGINLELGEPTTEQDTLITDARKRLKELRGG